MMVSVASRARRTLEGLENFRRLREEDALPIDLPEGEALIGVYFNNPPAWESAVIVTDKSIWLESEGP
jgi:hypothetical protein